MYDTNGLTLNDLYPYGQEHGDTARTNSDLPTAPLLEPINNLIGFGPQNLIATKYQVSNNVTFEDTPTGPILYKRTY